MSNDGTAIYSWIVHAHFRGWAGISSRRHAFRYALSSTTVQKVEGFVRAGDRREVANAMTLRGDDITFMLNITLDGLGLTGHEFSGKVNGDQIVGTVTVTPPDPQAALTLPWRARRTERSGYFAPTGTAMFQPPG